MSELFRYNLKKNIAVFFDFKTRKLKKFNFNKKKSYLRKKAEKEFKGYNWYIQRLKKKNNININVLNKSNHLELSLIRGKKFDFYRTFIFQEEKINNIVDHYTKIWPNKFKVPCHGDLTLDNIIFKDKEIYFIDWENFREKEDWGLDLAYFFISLVILPTLIQKQKFIRDSEIHFFKKLWQKNFKNKNYSYLNNPIEYMRKLDSYEGFFSKININLKNQILNAIK